MAAITLEKIEWSMIPEQPIPVSVLYKEKLQTDDEYIIVATGVIVQTDGSFTPVFIIGDLDINGVYTVKVISACGGYFAVRDFQRSDDAAAFSYGFSIGFYS